MGSVPIQSLTVLFPDDQVSFGDIEPGEMTKYVEVAHGVYGYAAYSLTIDGAVITQPVIDWVGEVPMDGESFTYSIAVEGDRIKLVKVSQDN